jgi:molybdenum cofactor sulfurtransferase
MNLETRAAADFFPRETATEELGEALRATERLDTLRQEEFSRLDRQGHVYLDYTGGSLYSEGQIRRHVEGLLNGVYGNPHSQNPSSVLSTEAIEATRGRVLDFFRADAEEYALIFTANASQALKLVGESYPFEAGDRFLLTFDNHNSVNGIREYDRLRGAETTYVPLRADLRVDELALNRELQRTVSGGHHLFAYPAQSNFSGVQHPLEWIERAHDAGWDVLLDAAAFVPTNRLDLSISKPDFVCLSFYKMFGFPTGVGALIARRDALGELHRPWFAGGTITVASVRADRHVMAPGEAGFEDGTPNFLAIPAVDYGLDLLDEVGLETVHRRVQALTGYLIAELSRLEHASGQRLVRIFGPRDVAARGGTIACNFYDGAGDLIDHHEIERLAAERNLSLRTGCFCNPGAGESALGLSRGELERCFVDYGAMSVEDFRGCIDPSKGNGAVRISLGLVSNLADADAMIAFAQSLVGSE